MAEANNKQSLGLSVILPRLGKGICLEGMLKLLTIDIPVPYELIFICCQADLDPLMIKRINDKYDHVHWIEKGKNTNTLNDLKLGVEMAAAKYILIVCADTVGPVITVSQMLNLADEGCDFISGTRYAARGGRLGGLGFEILLSHLANFILHLTGCAFTDATTGLKLLRKDVFEKLRLQSDSTGWVIAFEMALKAQFVGLRLGEVATIAVDRLYGGNSTCNYDQEFLEYIKWFIWGCLNLYRSATKKLSVPTLPIQISERETVTMLTDTIVRQDIENKTLPELSILLPVRNEAVNIPIMLKLLKAILNTSHEVIIIYDDIEDNSVPVVLAIQHKYVNLRLLYNDLGPGVLNALRKGVQNAHGKYILITCIDEVAPLLAIDDMVDLLRHGCDLVSGTRYAWGGRRLGGSLMGTLLSTTANILFRQCGSVLSDVTTGLKMFRPQLFDQLSLDSKPVGWVVAFEIGIKAQLHGIKLGEVPVLSLDRLYGGQSTFRVGPWFIEYLKLFWWGIKQLRNVHQQFPLMVRIPAVTPPQKRPVCQAVNVVFVSESINESSN